MADWPAESLGNKTLLQYSSTPYMDKLAAMGRTGRLVTVAPGFHPGSEVANMSVMGYNLPKVYEGRGPLEAASIGVELQPGDMAMRCNIICIEDEKIKNHSAGHITTEEADVLVRYLEEKLGSDRIHFYTGVQYRHLLVIKGGNKQLDCTPPHDVPLQPFRPLMVKAGQYPENAISGAIEYVRSFGYLDDARYAENFIMSRKDTKSKREIKALLSQKGVSDDLICLAFEQCYSEDSEEEAIRRILRKKKVDPERMEEQEYQKILGYLARKGFRYEVIRHVISDYDKQSD